MLELVEETLNTPMSLFSQFIIRRLQYNIYMGRGVEVICTTSWPTTDAKLRKHSTFGNSFLQFFFVYFHVILKQTIKRKTVFRTNESSIILNQFTKFDKFESVDS